ncbi:hypothetical protein F5884DRAFT_727081 [Xylogone sp. PMI_703]|nr:hypothetical protein F5884DRAFT_727081 [Xylogone sp. PMI_703]
MHFAQFLYAQLFATPPLPNVSFAEQTIIITGANRGLGFEAARHIHKLGVKKLVFGVRTVAKGEEAKAALIESNPNGTSDIEIWPLDLTSYSSVKAFAQRCLGLERIDAVLQNAAISTRIFTLAENNEATLTIVISTFLLTILLLPKLRESSLKFNTVPRVSIVGSEVHNWTPFKERNAPDGAIFATLNNKDKADMNGRYFLSKLLVMFAVRELAKIMTAASEKHKGRGEVILNCCAPGFVKTELDQESQDSMMFKIMEAVLARDVKIGSRCLVDGIAKGKESHGQYLSECKVKNPSKFVRSKEGAQIQKRVWDETIGKMELIQPGVSTLI